MPEPMPGALRRLLGLPLVGDVTDEDARFATQRRVRPSRQLVVSQANSALARNLLANRVGQDR